MPKTPLYASEGDEEEGAPPKSPSRRQQQARSISLRRVSAISMASSVQSIRSNVRDFMSMTSIYTRRAGNAMMDFLRRINGVGIFLGILCGLSYSLGGLIVKILNNNHKLHPVMLSGVRQTILIFLAGSQVSLCKAKFYGRDRREWIGLIGRALAGGVSTTLNFMAISHLPLGDAGVIFATTPAFTTLLAWLILREKCRASDIPVLFLSFLGVLFILRPPFIFQHIFPAALQAVQDVSPEDRIKGCAYAIVGAIVQAGVYLSLRMLRHTNFATISFFYAVCTAPILWGLTFSGGLYKTPPCYLDRLFAVSLSLSALAAQVFMALAAKFIPPGLVSLTRSSEVAFGFFWQAAFLGVTVNMFSISGCSLVLTSMVLLSIQQILTDKYREQRPENKFLRFILKISR